MPDALEQLIDARADAVRANKRIKALKVNHAMWTTIKADPRFTQFYDPRGAAILPLVGIPIELDASDYSDTPNWEPIYA